jgi:hypothetical protein
MTNVELAESIRYRLFADRETVQEAFEYAEELAKGSKDPYTVWTAVMVVCNTISKQILANEKEK